MTATRGFTEMTIADHDITVSLWEVFELAHQLGLANDEALAQHLRAEEASRRQDELSHWLTESQEAVGDTQIALEQERRLRGVAERELTHQRGRADGLERAHDRILEIAVTAGRSLALARGLNPRQRQVAGLLIAGEKIKAVRFWRDESAEVLGKPLGLREAKEDVEQIGYTLLGPDAGADAYHNLLVATQDAPLVWDGADAVDPADLLEEDDEARDNANLAAHYAEEAGRKALATAAGVSPEMADMLAALGIVAEGNPAVLAVATGKCPACHTDLTPTSAGGGPAYCGDCETEWALDGTIIGQGRPEPTDLRETAALLGV